MPIADRNRTLFAGVGEVNAFPHQNQFTQPSKALAQNWLYMVNIKPKSKQKS